MHLVEVLADAATAATAVDPIRAELLAQLRAPASATELAGRVGLSRQKVNYHLGKLAQQGLVEVVDTRRWGGLTERRLMASAAGYLLSPSALGAAAAAPATSGDRFSAAYLLALAGRLIREVGGMSAEAHSGDGHVPVLALDAEVRFRSPADRATFADELTSAVVRLVGRYHDEAAPDGRWQRLLVGVHPVPADMPVGAPTEENP